MSAIAQPRLIYTGVHPIGAANSSGVTLASVLSNWTDGALLQICLRDAPVENNRRRAIVMPEGTYPLNRLAHSIFGKRTIKADHHQMHNAVAMGSSGVLLATRIKRLARDIDDMGPVHLTPSLRDEVFAFRPQLVHSLLGTVREMRFALALSRHFNIPILPHFTDDWPSTIYGDGQLLGFARKESERLLAQILGRAPLMLTIGTEMAKEFGDRFGKPTVAVGNCVDAPSRRKTGSSDNSLVYVGGLHLGRNETIGKIASFLDSDGSTNQIKIDLYTGPNDWPAANQLAEKYRCVRACGSLPPSKVIETLASASGALFIESAETRILEYTRLSVSTKVPEYLASLAPVVVVGPSAQSSIKELMRVPQSIYGGDGTDLSMLAAALRAFRREGQDLSNKAEFPAWYSKEATTRRFAEAAVQSVSMWARENSLPAYGA